MTLITDCQRPVSPDPHGLGDAVNRVIDALLQFGENPSTTTGLTFGYYGGELPGGVTVADGTAALQASQTNYVEVSSTGTVSVNQTGFSAGKWPMRKLVTDTDSITTDTDARSLWSEKPGSGSGDVTGPASSTDGHIPQFDGTGGKTLKDGLALVTGTGSTGSNTAVMAEKKVYDAIAAVGVFYGASGSFDDTDPHNLTWSGSTPNVPDGYMAVGSLTVAGYSRYDTPATGHENHRMAYVWNVDPQGGDVELTTLGDDFPPDWTANLARDGSGNLYVNVVNDDTDVNGDVTDWVAQLSFEVKSVTI